MSFTQSQLTKLKNAALAEPSQANNITQGNDAALADWYNQPSTWVNWRTDVSNAECNTQIKWAEVDTLTSGKARIWEWMRLMDKFNMGDGNIRKGVEDAFGTASVSYVNIITISKSFASNAEKALSNGTGTDTTPGKYTWQGLITDDDIPIIFGRT